MMMMMMLAWLLPLPLPCRRWPPPPTAATLCNPPTPRSLPEQAHLPRLALGSL